jgi:hypothetical protein
MQDFDTSRRSFIKTVGYAAPVVVTLAAIPSFASAGSVRSGTTAGTAPHTTTSFYPRPRPRRRRR